MKKLFSLMQEALECGDDVVLCHVIASSGSSPRGVGAKMLVFADGSTLGTIGGGAVEYESARLARQALAQRTPMIHSFNLSPGQGADIGMVCGGSVVVSFRFFAGGDAAALALLGRIQELFEQRRSSWLVTRFAGGAAVSTGLYTREEGLLFADDIPPEALETLIRPRAVLTGFEDGYYAEPLTRAETVYVFGGGHVSQELVPLIARLGFSVIVYDDRPEFCTSTLFFAAADRVCAPYSEIFSHVDLRPEDYAIVMTRGHQSDYVVQEQLLRRPLSYVGVIGSAHKKEAVNRLLRQAGIFEEAIASVHIPIGLSIGADTPAEIAVSIAAELIAHRAAGAQRDA